MAAIALQAVLGRAARVHGFVEPVSSIAAATVAAAGIYGTSPTSHFGLAARIDGYEPAMLDRATQVERSVLRVPGPRGSVFLAPRELVPDFLGLARPRAFHSTRVKAGINDDIMEHLSEAIEQTVADGPKSAVEIRAALGENAPKGQLLTFVLRELLHLGRLVAARPLGGERATSYAYALMAEWAPLVRPVPNATDALRTMAPMWMRANGPGTVDDLAWWAGVTRKQAREALEDMDARPVAVDTLDGPQLATDEVRDALAGTGARGRSTRFLPVWDAWLMARRERERILDDGWRPYIVDRSGNVTNTIVRDGRIVGTWDTDGARLLVAPFESVAPEQLALAARRLRPTVDWEEIKDVDGAEPLDDGGQNRFRSPLRER